MTMTMTMTTAHLNEKCMSITDEKTSEEHTQGIGPPNKIEPRITDEKTSAMNEAIGIEWLQREGHRP
jgi:hypothetical protein